MRTIREILEGYRIEMQMRMRLQLETMVRGSLVRSQLPQSWNFKTEAELVCMTIDKEGNATLIDGSCAEPDVTIEWKRDLLASVLETRSLSGIPPGEEPVVTISTVRGKIGYTMMRRLLGF